MLLDVPPAGPTAILAGPAGTWLAAFENGDVGMWNPRNGKRLLRARLRGTIVAARRVRGLTPLNQFKLKLPLV